jgi:hypothetical protein
MNEHLTHALESMDRDEPGRSEWFLYLEDVVANNRATGDEIDEYEWLCLAYGLAAVDYEDQRD